MASKGEQLVHWWLARPRTYVEWGEFAQRIDAASAISGEQLSQLREWFNALPSGSDCPAKAEWDALLAILNVETRD